MQVIDNAGIVDAAVDHVDQIGTHRPALASSHKGCGSLADEVACHIMQETKQYYPSGHVKHVRLWRRTVAPPKRQYKTLFYDVLMALYPWQMREYPGILRGMQAICGPITRGTLQMWRSGRQFPSPQTLDTLAAHMRVKESEAGRLATALEALAVERRAHLARVRSWGKASAGERASATSGEREV